MKKKSEYEIREEVSLWNYKKEALKRCPRNFGTCHLRAYQTISEELVEARTALGNIITTEENWGQKKSKLINKINRLISELKGWYI